MAHQVTRRVALKKTLCGLAIGLPALTGKQLLSASSSLSDEIAPPERGAMAALAESFRQRFDAPGLSVAIARNGHLVYEQAFGVTGHDSSEQLTAADLFRIASVSKPITSVAVFTLVEKGRLQTQDTVFGSQGILGTDYGKHTYGEGIEQITIDHLLTHTSGGWDNGPGDPMFSNPQMNQAELISWTLDNQPLKNPPGRVFAYSNFGYCVLGRVIEKVTGQAYSDYVQQAVLLPCGITDMRIAGNSLEARAPEEVTYYGQYRTGREGHYEDPYAINVTRMDSHGGWISTATDLVRFAVHVDGFAANRNILKGETLRRMSMPSDVNPHYARGWRVNEKGHWWHGGDLPGTSAILVRTSSRFCWAGLTNTRRESSPRALDDLIWDMAHKVSAWRAALS